MTKRFEEINEKEQDFSWLDIITKNMSPEEKEKYLAQKEEKNKKIEAMSTEDRRKYIADRTRKINPNYKSREEKIEIIKNNFHLLSDYQINDCVATINRQLKGGKEAESEKFMDMFSKPTSIADEKRILNK